MCGGRGGEDLLQMLDPGSHCQFCDHTYNIHYTCCDSTRLVQGLHFNLSERNRGERLQVFKVGVPYSVPLKPMHAAAALAVPQSK